MTTKIKTYVTLKEQITKLAFNKNKKANKLEAYRAFTKLVTAIDKNDPESKVKFLATICSHLLPAHPKLLAKKDRGDDFKWINQAVSKDKSRIVLCHAHADEEFMVATDGKRMHLISNTKGKFDLGFYNSVETKIDLNNSFPSYRMVLPDYKKYYNATVCTDKSAIFELIEYNNIYTYELLVSGYTLMLNAEYVDQALCGAEEFTLYSIDPLKSVVIAYDDRVAVLMPMRDKR